MNKNKIMAYTLAATLMVGGTFAGTKALFTDNATLAQNISISMGTLNVDAQYETAWNLDTVNPNAQLEQADLSVMLRNAKPGDVISKELYVANEGSLDLDATIQVAEIEGLNVSLSYIGSTASGVEVTPLTEGNGYQINNLPGNANGAQDSLFVVTVEVPESLTEQGGTFEFNGDFIKVTAAQK